jgi:uncharacterized integral membrane protein
VSGSGSGYAQGMSVSASPDKSARPTREKARTGALVVLAVVATLFAVLNTESVQVNWILGSGHAPLIIVIVISLLAGLVLAYMADRLSRRRKGG